MRWTLIGPAAQESRSRLSALQEKVRDCRRSSADKAKQAELTILCARITRKGVAPRYCCSQQKMLYIIGRVWHTAAVSLPRYNYLSLTVAQSGLGSVSRDWNPFYFWLTTSLPTRWSCPILSYSPVTFSLSKPSPPCPDSLASLVSSSHTPQYSS